MAEYLLRNCELLDPPSLLHADCLRTWPTIFVQHAYGYEWDGTFPSSGADGQTTCLSASREFVPYPITTTPAQPVPTFDFAGENGLNYKPMRTKGDGAITRSLNPLDPILQTCTYLSGIGGVAALPTAQFLTATSTSIKKKSSVPTQGAALPADPLPIVPPPPPPPPPPPTEAPQPIAPAQPAPPSPIPNVEAPPTGPAAQQPAEQLVPAQQAGLPQPAAPLPATPGNVAAPAPVAASPGGNSNQPQPPIATTVVTGAGFSFTLAVPAGPAATPGAVTDPQVPAAQQPGVQQPGAQQPGVQQPAARPQPGQTVVNGVTFVPVGGGLPSAGTTLVPAVGNALNNGGGAVNVPISLTVINGQTFAPIGTNQAAVVPALTPAPSLVIGGSTFAAVTSIANIGQVFNVGGQALTVGSTITLGSGTAATTVALQTDVRGNTVLITASAGQTRSSTVTGPQATGARTTSGVGDFVGSGINGSRTGNAPAQQTANAAVIFDPGFMAGTLVAFMLLVHLG